MKTYDIDVHFDASIRMHGIIAESEEQARTIARRMAKEMNLFAAAVEREDAGEKVAESHELTPQEIRREEHEAVSEFVSEYIEQQTPTEVKDIAEGYGVNWLEWVGQYDEEWKNNLFGSISEATHPDTAIFERYARMYARRRWQEVAREQAREWDEAFQKAKADPKTYRVIVETNEREEETGDGDRYFMIDKSDGCGNEYDRWQVIRCDCAASPYDTRTAKAYSVGTEAQPSCEASPNNVTRWAERMINAGRVVSIYADCY